MLLKPFVEGPGRLHDGLPPSLTGDATPRVLCRQASGAIISQTSVFQLRSGGCLPPLLPHMVAAGVLHQSSPATEQQYGGLAELPGPLSLQNAGEWHHSLCQASSSISRSDGSLSPRESLNRAEEPSFATATRNPSILSSASTCYSHAGDPARRPSMCSFATGTTVGRNDSSSSSDTAPDALPTFTSRPSDLVALGTLQLTSMAADHPGAAQVLHNVELECARNAARTRTSSSICSWSLPDAPFRSGEPPDGTSAPARSYQGNHEARSTQPEAALRLVQPVPEFKHDIWGSQSTTRSTLSSGSVHRPPVS